MTFVRTFIEYKGRKIVQAKSATKLKELPAIPKRQTLNRFTERVLMINLPTASCLLLLVMIGELVPLTAVITFATIVMVSILIIIPFMEQLQSVTDYSRSLAKSIDEGGELPVFSGGKLGEEYSEIIGALNKLHNVWNTKTEAAEPGYLSDSAILDILPDPLLLLGSKEEVLGANLAARNLFGENVRARTLKKIIGDEGTLDLIANVLRNKSEKEEAEYQTTDTSKNKKILLLKIQKLPALAHSGAIAALIFHDVTEARNLEQMQADFVANASHELRTPLSVISGFIETLETAAKNDEAAREKFLPIMSEQALRMSKLIESLLSLSRIQMQSSAPVDEVNLKELIAGLSFGLEGKLKENRMTLKNMIRQTPPIMGVAGELTQVFQNLIDNAIKYGKADSEIILSSKKVLHPETGKDMIAISVNNQGDIIPPDQIPRVCERFYRIDTEKTRNRIGSGLGLAIVKMIVDRHGGLIDIESNDTAGTTFTVSFPVASSSL